MKLAITSGLVLIATVTSASAQSLSASVPANLPLNMAEHDAPASVGVPNNFSPDKLHGVQSDIPTAALSKIATKPFSEPAASTRSAKDAEIYRIASPSVVLILTKEGLGSGSLIDGNGYVITNYHVVKGYSDVAVVFKPNVEGIEPTRDDMRSGQVVKYDEVADLALVKVAEFPAGKWYPIRLGDTDEISVGADVHAIGHPTGEAWTYTTGVISQYRIGAEWTAENVNHKADVIQTQTPISPGSSGGPLLSDAVKLIGINSFLKEGGEGLNSK